MTLTAGHIAPIVALIAGILILVIPRLLNYIVATYGLDWAQGIYHFVNENSGGTWQRPTA